MTWELVKPWFAPDGALRDIYVYGTSRADWQAFVEAVAVWGYSTLYTIDGQASLPPESADEAFAATHDASVLLRIDVASVDLHCHFFGDDDLELAFEPAEVPDHSTFDEMLGFVARLGDLLEKPVHLTMENSPEPPIVTYSPTTGSFHYHGLGG